MRSHIRLAIGGAALGLGMIGAPALAQAELSAGSMVGGEIESADAPATLSLRLAPGQALQLDAIPGAPAREGLDLTLKVFDPAGTVVAEDDDSGGAYNPRVNLFSQTGGLYKVEVGALGGGGTFTLLARESTFKPQPTIAMRLDGGGERRSVVFPESDKALFSFAARRGDLIDLTLTPGEGEDDADPFLELFKGAATGTALATDDDSLGGLGSRIVADIPEDGTYVVRVSSLSSKGSATLGLAKMAPRVATLGTLPIGRATTINLSEASPFIIAGTEHRLWPYALYRFPTAARPAQPLQITATSDTLDPWLEVGFETPLGFTPVLSNDDTNGTNSRLTLDPTVFDGEDGQSWWDMLRIRVSAPPGTSGEVQLTASSSGGD